VVITDYPDTELIDNIRYNLLNCGIEKNIQAKIAVEGYLWGSDATPLLSHLANDSKFDIIILSDTVSSFSAISLIRRSSTIPNTTLLSNHSSST
jgi:nicotinamide N-methyltransferase